MNTLMILQRMAITFLALLYSLQIFASEKKFEFNINCQYAYHASMAMRFQKSDSLIAIEKKKHPENLIPYFIEDFKRFFISAFNQNPNEISKFEIERNDAIKMIETGPKDSPYYLYALGEINIHSAIIAFTNENYFTAYFELKKGYDILTQNQKLFPSFIANKILLGLIHSAIGTVPDSYKWFTSLVGLKGSEQQGIAEVQEVIDYSKEHPFLFEDEAIYALIIQKLWLQNDLSSANDFAESNKFPTLKNNSLAVYIKAFIKLKLGKNDDALGLFSSLPENKNVFVPVFAFYMLGIAQIQKLDTGSRNSFQYFNLNYKGKLYLKDSYRRIAWSYLIEGNTLQYESAIKSVSSKGNLFSDADKDAEAEAENRIVPDKTLLQSRLLSDGGYYQKAWDLLNVKTEKDFISQKDKIEFYYRSARICDEWNKKEKAVSIYQMVITKGSGLQYYFAANSCLKLGEIYEKENLADSARYYYLTCLSLKDHEYKSSIDQKAKAGLSRLQNQ